MSKGALGLLYGAPIPEVCPSIGNGMNHTTATRCHDALRGRQHTRTRGKIEKRCVSNKFCEISLTSCGGKCPVDRHALPHPVGQQRLLHFRLIRERQTLCQRCPKISLSLVQSWVLPFQWALQPHMPRQPNRRRRITCRKRPKTSFGISGFQAKQKTLPVLAALATLNADRAMADPRRCALNLVSPIDRH